MEKTVTVDGEKLSVARIIAHGERVNREGGADEVLTVEEAVWSYYLALLARRLCGERGFLVTEVVNTWTPDWRVAHVEATFGCRPTVQHKRRDPSVVATDTRSRFLVRDRDEIGRAADAVRAAIEEAK